MMRKQLGRSGSLEVAVTGRIRPTRSFPVTCDMSLHVADGTKAAHRLILREGDRPGSPRRAPCHHQDPCSVGESGNRVSVRARKLRLPVLALRTEEKATHRRMRAASRCPESLRAGAVLGSEPRQPDSRACAPSSFQQYGLTREPGFSGATMISIYICPYIRGSVGEIQPSAYRTGRGL